MDKQQLVTMDACADEAISNWSIGAVAANILPPPFAEKALGTVFTKVVEDLSNIYERKGDLPRSQDIGNITRELIEVWKDEQNGKTAYNSYLKYIPGINIWFALVMQPEMVTAITESVGDAFKKYFHALLESSDLPMEEVTKIAKDSLREKLQPSAPDSAASTTGQADLDVQS